MSCLRRRCCYRRCFNNDIAFDDVINIVKEQNALVIDVRSKQEYIEAHFNGAINIPLGDIRKMIRNATDDFNRCIIVYCSSGIRSKKAQEILRCMGYNKVYNVMDGFY